MFPAEMPIPVSRTQKCRQTWSALCDSLRTSITTSPSSVNFTALPSRLTITCLSRPGSPINASGTSSGTWQDGNGARTGVGRDERRGHVGQPRPLLGGSLLREDLLERAHGAEEVRWAEFRLHLGDELFSRAFPAAPMLAP